MRLLSWRGLLGLGSGLALVVFWGVVALRIATSADNHLAVSVLWIIPLALAAMIAGGLWWSAPFRRAGAALMLLGLLTIAGAMLLDRLNILVGYETWLRRGMPERPF